VRPPTHPATGKPLFELPQGQIEVGAGVHGEAGVYRGPHLSADELVDLLTERLLADLQPFNPTRLLVFINGAGGTSRMELHILYRRLHYNLQARGLTIAGCVVDSLFTTQEMGGASLSLCAVDSEMMDLWQAPAAAPCFYWPRPGGDSDASYT
jgi:dihydroxyacetone kinase